MESYTTLLTDVPWDELKPLHPKEAKVRLAKAIVAQYHSAEEAERQAAEFDRVFGKKELPADMPSISVAVQEPVTARQLFGVATEAFQEHLHIHSRAELRRIISQGGFRVNGRSISDVATLAPGNAYTLQAGPRRFLRVTLR